MKIILGMGNAGREYEQTRHNVGFQLIDRLARTAATTLRSTRCRALTGMIRLAGQPVLLAKPQTYVNRSGEAARALLKRHQVPIGDLLVVVDDVNLPVGRLRARRQGSAGGHNGLESLIDHLGTEGFARLRVGVGNRRDPEQDLADHVLGRFEPEEAPSIEAAIVTAADACRVWVAKGIEACMNQFNAGA